MTIRYYCGIDSGAKGAIAFLNADGSFNSIIDMPTPKGFIEGIKNAIWDCDDSTAVAIESVHPLPGQSCMASFSYGGNFMLAKLLGIWYQDDPVMVSPQKWKGFYGLKRNKDESKTDYKHRSVELAKELFPSASNLLTISKDGRAEALLIANWLFRSYNG